jgi:hypothetical protein
MSTVKKVNLSKALSEVDFWDLPSEVLIEVRDVIAKNSYRFCPECLSTRLQRLSSQYKKVCNNCGCEIDWPLAEKEKPVI